MKKYIAIGIIVTSSILYYFLFSDIDEIIPVFSNLPVDQVIEYGSIVDFNDLGLTANDETDGDVSNRIRNDIGNPRNLDLGSYVITYTVTDLSGNEATTSINLTVVDTTAPLVVVNTEDIQSTFEVGSTEIDLIDYIEITDNYDLDFLEGNLDFSLENFDIDTIGTYQIPVNYTDSEGNVALETLIEIKLVHEWTSLEFLHYSEINDGTEIKIDYYSSYDPIDLYIPYYIDGLPVTEIGESAFDGFYTRINSVEIPDTVRTIGQKAFTNNNLSSLIIPSSVEYIGVDAFSGNNLSELTVLEGGIILDEWAFSNNILETIIFHDGPTVISPGAFSNNLIVNLTLPEGLLIIEHYTFVDNFITELIIPSTVTEIQSSAFSNNNLTSLVIPNTVTNIGIAAFSSNSLTSVTLPEGIDTIPPSLFAYNNLTSIDIPESVTFIGDYAFMENNLTEISLHEGITGIGQMSFSFNNITSVYLPNSLTRNWDGYSMAFLSNAITSFSVSPDNPSFSAIDGVLFNKDGIILYSYPDGDLTSSYVVPENVVHIYRYAFYESKVESVTIPEGITEIKESTFEHSSINTIYLPSTLNSIDFRAFSFTTMDSIFIPENVEIINDTAFRWSFIGEFIVDENNTIFKSIDGSLLSKDGRILILYPRGDLRDTYVIPEGVEYILDNLFNETTLTLITLPSSLNELTPGTFGGAQFTTFYIPETVFDIEEYTFFENLIGEFVVDPNNLFYKSVDGVLYNKDGNLLICFPGGDLRESFTIQAEVDFIYFGAFSNNSLTSITILGDEYRFNEFWNLMELPNELMPIEPTE